METLKTKLGQRIKYLRKSKNITQEKLAEITNMDITSLSKIETGKNYPQPETVEKIANALNVEISQIFSFKKILSKDDYINAIKKNIEFIAENEEKLQILYKFSELLI